MNVNEHIKILLTHFECVVVPEFGGFILNPVHASVNMVRQTILSPGFSVTFNRFLDHHDGLLAKYISTKENISYREALDVIRDFVKQIESGLKTNRFYILAGIGRFELNKQNVLLFESEAVFNEHPEFYGLAEVPAIQIRTEPAKVVPIHYEKVITKTYWRKVVSAAVVFMIFSSSVILYRQTFETDDVVRSSAYVLPDVNPGKYLTTIPRPSEPDAQFPSSAGNRSNDTILFDTIVIRKVISKKELSAKHLERTSLVIEDEGTPAVPLVQPKLPAKPEDKMPKGKATPAKQPGTDHPVTQDTYTSTKKYKIVAGVFSSREKALDFISYLKNIGLNATLEPNMRRQNYRVIAGSYSTREAAEQGLTQTKRIVQDSWILTI